MTFEELKQNYLEDIKLEDATIHTKNISLPQVIAKYQFYFYDVLKEISTVNEDLDRLYYEAILDYKQGTHDLSNFDFNSSELQKMIKASPDYRTNHLKLMNLENELKTVEEMMTGIKNIGFSLRNSIELQKLDLGVI